MITHPHNAERLTTKARAERRLGSTGAVENVSQQNTTTLFAKSVVKHSAAGNAMSAYVSKRTDYQAITSRTTYIRGTVKFPIGE